MIMFVRPTSLEQMEKIVKDVSNNHPALASFFGNENLLYLVTQCSYWSLNMEEFFMFLNMVVAKVDSNGSYFYGEDFLAGIVRKYAEGGLINDVAEYFERAKVS